MRALHHAGWIRGLRGLGWALLLTGSVQASASRATWPVATWQAASWADLPGWGRDAFDDLPAALHRHCERPATAWRRWCQRWQQGQRDGIDQDPLLLQAWLVRHLQPWRVEAAGGTDTGLLTGYFEPELEARREPQPPFVHPLFDLRQRPLAYLSDPVDAVLLQVQGSGRLRLTEPDGRTHWRRLSWAGDNGQGFQSLGRWLVQQGAVHEGQASWSTIKAWTAQNPERVPDLLRANPRTVYFREEALGDPALGPKGAQGLPLTPGRSVAVDPRAVPYGSLLWLDASHPARPEPLQRLVLAQDTGSVITGAVRADYFWGWGAAAMTQATRTQHALRWWALWPAGEAPPR